MLFATISRAKAARHATPDSDEGRRLPSRGRFRPQSGPDAGALANAKAALSRLFLWGVGPAAGANLSAGNAGGMIVRRLGDGADALVQPRARRASGGYPPRYWKSIRAKSSSSDSLGLAARSEHQCRKPSSETLTKRESTPLIASPMNRPSRQSSQSS